MRINFQRRERISRITQGTVSSDSKAQSMWGALNLFGDRENGSKKSINSKVLQYHHTLRGTVNSITATDSCVSALAVENAVNSLSATWPELPFDLSDIATASAYIELDVGDGVVPGSFQYTDVDSNIYKDYSFSGNASYVSLPTSKVGYISDQSSPMGGVWGYIFYDIGIAFLSGSLAQSVTSWDTDNSNYLNYSTRLDQHEHIYLCNLDRRRTWNSSNHTYWTSIDQSNATLTSALTAYWSEQNYDYTISADARDWVIIEDQSYPIYVTGVGLYDDENNLLAVAKLRKSQPVYNNFDMSFVVNLRF